ncbi:cupin domain-containing protein [Novosphingobium panipatense]|uniref:Cupin domain-containing protein n=1 Tax=Novosphingobium panipatense TaxID=428991 RepID=A0ABY1QF34_9SPHN|nr:cupin domain-containing protein [Novosphingobium panipatense]SMP69506.1 Cupin domain-containing protein [Novosphingobium panipatense]
MTGERDLRTCPVHLGLGGRVEAQPPFVAADWYEAYAKRTAADGGEGRLVSLFDFSSDWDTWEMHPHGDELIVCISGEMTVIQERPDGAIHAETLGAGQYLINPAGVWHTANILGRASALFVTAGQGTRQLPR